MVTCALDVCTFDCMYVLRGSEVVGCVIYVAAMYMDVQYVSGFPPKGQYPLWRFIYHFVIHTYYGTSM